MRPRMLPLLTREIVDQLRAATRTGKANLECSLDLKRSATSVVLAPSGFLWLGESYPYPEPCRERTVYHWTGREFQAVARYGASLVKLVPTEWGPPTFEIDGIKMLPTARGSPYADAERKVRSVQPRGKVILDTCGGLGYFAACCLEGEARQVLSFEKSPDVLWLRSLNPWSPTSDDRLNLKCADVVEEIKALPSGSIDAILHDPPRFRVAGELYSQAFYDELARVIRRRGRLFHYTGRPNELTSGRDVPAEVSRRLQRAGFETHLELDGVSAVRS